MGSRFDDSFFSSYRWANQISRLLLAQDRHEIFAKFAFFTREYLKYLKDGTAHENAFLKMQSYGMPGGSNFLAHKHF